MQQVDEFRKKNINLDKFLFLYKEQTLPTLGLFNFVNLQLSVLAVSAVNLIIATSQVNKSIHKFSFLVFLFNFLPGAVLAIGSVLLLLSIQKVDKQLSYWGYLLTAASIYIDLITTIFSLVFIKDNFITSLFYFIITFSLSLYFVWIDYAYAKQLSEGHRSIVISQLGLKLQSETATN